MSRVGVHGADGETAATAASYWNKSPQLRPCHGSMDPDVVVVLVGVWSRGSIADSMGYLGAQGLPLLLLVGGFAGFLSCQASQLAVVKAVAALLCKVVGMAKRSAERRLKDLDHFPGSLRRAPGLDQRSTGRGPGRRATLVYFLPSLKMGNYCGSDQSQVRWCSLWSWDSTDRLRLVLASSSVKDSGDDCGGWQLRQARSFLRTSMYFFFSLGGSVSFVLDGCPLYNLLGGACMRCQCKSTLFG